MKNNLQPLASVIVPTYNGEKRIEKTLNSIIEQDYENLEIIIVDDVSTDNTVEIVKNILEKSKRNFQIIQRTVNGHQSASRNTGLKASNGKYVIFFDHDDLAEKNFVSSLCNEAENKNADCVFCGLREFFEAENIYKYYPITPKKPFETPEEYLKAWSHDRLMFGYVWCFIFKKDFLIKNKLCFPEKNYISEDVEFVLKALALSSKTSFVKNMSYIYIRHAGQQSTTDSENRNNYKIMSQLVLSRWHTARCIIKHTKDKHVRSYVLSFRLAHDTIKQLTACAYAGDIEYFNLKLKNLKHKKIREILLGTIKFIFKEPELFFKSLMLLYAPNFYYSIRKKKEARNED